MPQFDLQSSLVRRAIAQRAEAPGVTLQPKMPFLPLDHRVLGLALTRASFPQNWREEKKADSLYKKILNQSLELLNLPKLIRNIINVRKNPTLDGISSATSAAESLTWRIVGSSITAGLTYAYTGSWALAGTMVGGDFITKIAGYAGVKKALKKIANDKKLSLPVIFGNSLLWRLKGSTVTGGIFLALSRNSEAAQMLFLWDFGLKLGLNTACSWFFEQIDHAWKYQAISYYRQKNTKPLLLKLGEKIKALCQSKHSDTVAPA